MFHFIKVKVESEEVKQLLLGLYGRGEATILKTQVQSLTKPRMESKILDPNV